MPDAAFAAYTRDFLKRMPNRVAGAVGAPGLPPPALKREKQADSRVINILLNFSGIQSNLPLQFDKLADYPKRRPITVNEAVRWLIDHCRSPRAAFHRRRANQLRQR